MNKYKDGNQSTHNQQIWKGTSLYIMNKYIDRNQSTHNQQYIIEYWQSWSKHLFYFFSMIKNNFLLKYITIWYYYYNVRQFTDLYFLNIVIILTCSQLYKKHKIFLSNIPILKITYTSLNKSKEYDTYFIFLWKLFEIYSD
jgi:hypothetical protein